MNLNTALTSLAQRAGAVTGIDVGLRWGSLGDFFRYHGIYAPGVRLLRSLTIPQKVMVVALCFLVPMGLLARGYLAEALDLRQRTRVEIDGARFARQAVRLISALQLQRRHEFLRSIGAEVPGPDKGSTGVDEAFASLAATQAQVGEVLNTDPAFAEVQRVLGDLRRDPSTDVVQRMTRFSDAVNAVNHLLHHLAGASRMRSDPDPSTHYLAALSIEGLNDAVEHASGLRGAGTLRLTGRQDDAIRTRVLQRYALLTQLMPGLQAGFAQLAAARPEQARALNFEQAWKPLRALVEESHEQVLGPQASGEPRAYNALGDLAVAELVALQQRGLDQLEQNLAQRSRADDAGLWALLSAVAVFIALAIYLLMSFYRVMSGGLGLLQEQVSRMADGDLSARPRPWGSDEVATALASLGDSLSRLADLFAAIKQGVAAISHASTAIAGGTGDLSGRTHEAVAGVAQILRGVEAYVVQLEQSGRRVDEAVEAVHGLRLDALRSRDHMRRLEERMHSLRGKSAQIGEIVELIDHIAFRTNILALNASVEAAKAGEAGRSFAVVAQEVRSLAARSAESARRVQDIVLGSTEDIEQSGALADLTAKSLSATEAHVGRIHEAMNDIVGLTRAGQQNSQEILSEIRGVNEAAGRNLTLVDQMAQAADDLSGQGDRLNEKVRGFKLA